MKNPCKTCLVYPACREKCDKLDKHRDKLIKILRYSGVSFAIVTFGLFVLANALLNDHKTFSPAVTGIITIPISVVLIFTGIYTFVECYDIARRMLRRYPK